MGTHALSPDRCYRRLVRNARRAADLWGRLVGATIVHRRGHTYRLVPEKTFEEIMATLQRLGGLNG